MDINYGDYEHYFQSKPNEESLKEKIEDTTETNNQVVINGKSYSVKGRNISIQGSILKVDGEVVVNDLSGPVEVKFIGDVANISAHNVQVKGDVRGSINAHNVVCGDVAGNVIAHSVNCKPIKR